MSKIIFVAGLLLPMIFIFGCREETIKDDIRFRVDPAQAAVVVEQGFAVPGATEVDLVEQMAVSRNTYRTALSKLIEYYRTTGNATKLNWAQRELSTMLQYRYLMPAESTYAGMQAINKIAAADELFDEAMALYKDAGGLLFITNERKLRSALNKFNELITNYPSSDKIDDAAYRAGRIYEHFRDYEIAAVYYQRAFQWDEYTPYPARFRAAYVMDQYLRMRKEALTLYQMACELEARYETNTEFAQKRVLELTRPKDRMQLEETPIQEPQP
jgi:tetratricopeptide (TPR) repeat protein